MWVAQNTPELQAPMLSGSEEEQSTRRPFEFLTSIFKRRREHECETETEDEATSITTTPTTATATTTRHPDITLRGPDDGQSWTRDGMVSPPRRPPAAACLEASVTSLEDGGVGAAVGAVHHTPVKSRDIGIDMEAIRLSRQDNPYLQRVAESQTTLTEEEEAAEDVGGSQQEDRAHLVTQASQEGALSLSEVHEHLIRSPPPTSLPRTLPKSVFVFPVNQGVEGPNAPSEAATGPAAVSGGGAVVTPAAAAAAIGPNTGRPLQVLKPVVTRQHEDVLDHNLRQILHTQRQLVVAKGRPGEGGGGGGAGAGSCSSVPASPAHSRALTRRSPHARTQSEEASVAQNIGGACEASPGGGLFVGGGVGMSVSAPGMGTAGTGGGSLSGLAPVLPPGRRQYSSSDLLLNPANAPIGSSTPTAATPTPTPPVLKPISSKSKKGGSVGPEAGSSSSSSAALRLPIRCPHQPAASSPLVDIT